MKTYKIDPLGKNRPLMLVRGTRLPESLPDSVAEHMAKSLKANCRGVFTTINGEISSLTASPGVVVSREANEDNNTLVVMTEGEPNESVEWEDNTGKQFRLEHAGRFGGSQNGGHDLYYTGAHKDLRTFVTGAVPYTGQPLVAANAKQWYSYTTPEGVALTFRGCIQAPIKEGTDFVGLKIDSINFLSSDTSPSFKLTLDCDRAISLGLRNGMNDNSKPFNMRPGIGWLQIVATDDFKSHLHEFNSNAGNGDATIDPYEAYDGFTYNVNLAALNTQPGGWVCAGNYTSFEISVKSGSALENSTIANTSGFACESLGVDMSGSGDTFPIVEEVAPMLNAEPTVVNLTTDNYKNIVVIRFSSVQEGEQLHLDLSDTVTAPGVIHFRSINTATLGIKSLGSGEKSFVIDIPRGDDVFAFFGVNYNTAGTLTISRTKEAVVPTRAPGFYSADGQLVKAMTKEEVEQNYTYTNCPSNGNDAVKNATSFVWPDGVTTIGNYVFYECSGLASVTIPSTVTSIGNSAFDSCSALTSIEVPSTVTSIGNGAFSKCSGLTSVSIPSTVTSIGNSTFSMCTGLTSVAIPEGVTSIGNSAFSGCTGLTSVTIPSTVTSIGNFAFKKCTGLNPLTVPNTVTTIDTDAFKDVPKVIYGGTATGTPWGALEVVAPKPTPGFYSADGQLVKAMTKEEVETDYTFDNHPTSTTPAIINATNFVWPEGVTKVGNNAFSGCSGLTSVTIPSTVTSIGEYAFSRCSGLTSVTIPEGVTSIGGGAFNKCTALTTAPIPEGVTSIGGYAFGGCSGLTSVTIPSTVTSIGSHAFDGCSGLTSVTIPEGVTSIYESTFKGCTGLTSVTIPSTVTSIGYNAFCGCSALTSVTIPEGVISIGMQAFSDCTGLNPLTVPNTVAIISDDAFKNVPKVIYGGTASGTPWGALEVVAPVRTPGFYSSNGTLLKAMTKEEVETDYTVDNKPSTTTPEAMSATEFVWPEGVTKVGNHALDNCWNLTSVSIPEGVTSIGEYTFRGCSGLTSVTIPEGVTSIGNSAFSNCSGLTSVTIPSTVTTIGDTAFNGCTRLNPLTVPNTVTTIDGLAFNKVPKVIYGGTATGKPWGALEVVAPQPTPDPGPGPEPEPDPEPTRDPGFYSAEGQLVKAMTKEEVETDYQYTQAPASVNEAVKNATNFVWPEGVTKVGNNAFYGCSSLTSVAIPEGVTSIGNSAFDSCSALTSVTIPSTVTSIGNGALSKCSGLTSVSIPSTVTSISNSAFSYCTRLASVTIPEGVTSIGNSALSGCTGLTSITIPSTVTSIGQWAFKKCSALNPLTVPNTVTTIGKDAFKDVPKVVYGGTASGSPWGAVEVSAS